MNSVRLRRDQEYPQTTVYSMRKVEFVNLLIRADVQLPSRCKLETSRPLIRSPRRTALEHKTIKCKHVPTSVVRYPSGQQIYRPETGTSPTPVCSWSDSRHLSRVQHRGVRVVHRNRRDHECGPSRRGFRKSKTAQETQLALINLPTG